MTGARVASRGVNYTLLGLALIGLGIAKLAFVHWEMDSRLQKTSFGTEGCTRYRDMMSPEDIIPVFEGVFVGSSDERRKHAMNAVGAEAAPWGELFAIWNVDTAGQHPKTARLELEGFPVGTAFRPHGMHYQSETGELFVINHAYSQGGERIDVFKVSETFPQDPLPTIHPSLFEVTPKPPLPEGKEGAARYADNAPVAIQKVIDGVDNLRAMLVGAVTGGNQIDDNTPEAGVARSDAAEGGGQEAGDAAEEDGEEVGLGGGGQGEGEGEGGGGEDLPEGRSYDEKRDETLGDQVEIEAVEEIVETPKERAKRVKRETKEKAAKAKEESRKQRAIEKAASARANARAKGLSRGEVPVKLTYSFTVEHEYITTNYGSLNDLVMASNDEIYVTQWQAQPHPLHGPTQPDGLLEFAQVLATKLAPLFQYRSTPIIRCTGIRGPDISCERMAKGGGVMYNGIALSPNKERLLVSDSAAMQMVVFDRSLETGALTKRQRLDLRASPDNLEIDLNRAAKGEEAYTVGILSAWDFLAYTSAMAGAKDASDGDHLKVAGGMTSLSFDEKLGREPAVNLLGRRDPFGRALVGVCNGGGISIMPSASVRTRK
eukprot:jgi/Undpi1/3874/HiC_scaffold_16.g07242.m1